MTENIQATPPHLPTYNVRLSSEQIRAIVTLALPNETLLSSRQLESGKSFNNRIYFIQTKSKPSISGLSSSVAASDFVLKLSGHYFGARKVQNEIGSLLLLGKYCPSVPIPRVIAWSEDGSTIQTLDGRTLDMHTLHKATESADHVAANAFSKHGWILTTRLPGRILSKSDLDGPYRDSLLKEIANHLATWRLSIPQIDSIGNLRFTEPSEKTSPTSSLSLFDNNSFRTETKFPYFTPGGLILCHRYSPDPLPTTQSYYIYQATDQLFHLRRSPILEPLRHKIEPQVQKLMNELPRLSFLNQDPSADNIKFTHFDFSPRNILISEREPKLEPKLKPKSESEPEPESRSDPDQPHVSGILDFEFSAFLPSDEEFVNMAIRQSDDWTPEEYRVITAELATRLGCSVPHLSNQYGEPVCTKATEGACTCDSGAFEGVCILAKVIENIAPWFIQEGSHSLDELMRQIDMAAEAVTSGIEKLQRFLT